MPELDQDPLDPEISEATEETAGSETPDAEPEGDATEGKGPKHIPYDRFQEVWNERQDARHQTQQLQMQVLNLQNQIAFAMHQQNAPKPTPVDPEIEQIVAPVLNKVLGPLQQQLQMAQNELLQVRAKGEAEAAWNYVMQNVPDMDDLKDDIAREIEKKSPTVQKKITSDPDLVIELAEKVRLQKATGQISSSKRTQADLKTRTRSEVGGPGTNPTNSKTIDWENLSDEDFRAMDARIQRQKYQS